MATGEASLIRECSGLYASFAFESLSSFLLGMCFLYLLLLMICKHRLRNPGLAVGRMIGAWLSENLRQLWSTLRTWPDMPRQPLEVRFGFCRHLNMAICVFSAFVAMISITRWFHVGNVNGFRYLGYALTCPLMQAELAVLIAPVVPCFRMNVIATVIITFSCMASGYAGSLYEGDLWNGSLADFVQTLDLEMLEPTTKFWVITPAFVCLGMLSFVQLPWLAFLYTCKGGIKHCAPCGHSDLPWQFRRLLLLVAVTWMFFPIWWLLSSEGMSIITDTKLNGFGFVLSNIVSKGGFSLQLLSMVRWHKRQWGRRTSLQDIAMEEQQPWFIQVLQPFDTQSEAVSASVEKAEQASTGTHHVDAVSGWDLMEDEYKSFLESAGVTEVDFKMEGTDSRVGLRIRYLELLRNDTSSTVASAGNCGESPSISIDSAQGSATHAEAICVCVREVEETEMEI